MSIININHLTFKIITKDTQNVLFYTIFLYARYINLY